MITIQKKPMYAYLLVLTICSTGGLHLWRTLFDNFAVHMIKLDGHHVGIIQSIREIPGFLALLVVYVLLFVKEHRLSALSVLCLGLGVSLTGMLPSFSGILFTTLLMSFGFHYFETTNQSLTLQYFDTRMAPLVFGKLRSMGAASCIIVSALVFLIAPFLDYRAIYILFGGVIIAGSLWALCQNPADHDIVPQHKHMVF